VRIHGSRSTRHAAMARSAGMLYHKDGEIILSEDSRYLIMRRYELLMPCARAVNQHQTTNTHRTRGAGRACVASA
jgi:hypothetical protein